MLQSLQGDAKNCEFRDMSILHAMGCRPKLSHKIWCKFRSRLV